MAVIMCVGTLADGAIRNLDQSTWLGSSFGRKCYKRSRHTFAAFLEDLGSFDLVISNGLEERFVLGPRERDILVLSYGFSL
jgi:hypothetical protein